MILSQVSFGKELILLSVIPASWWWSWPMNDRWVLRLYCISHDCCTTYCCTSIDLKAFYIIKSCKCQYDIIFIHPSSVGTYYAMVMSVWVSVCLSQFSTFFSYMLWRIELKFSMSLTSYEHSIKFEYRQFLSMFFSASEPKAQVHYCDHALSVVRPSLTFHIFDFSSETAE